MVDNTQATDPVVIKAKRTFLDVSVKEAKDTLAPLTEALQGALTQIKGSEFEAGGILNDVQYSGILVAAGHPKKGDDARVWDSKAMDVDYVTYYTSQGLDRRTADVYVTRFLAGTAVAENTDYLEDGSQIVATHAQAIIPVVRGYKSTDNVVKVMDEAFRIADDRGTPMTADDIKEARNILEIMPLRAGGEKTDDMKDAETFGRHLASLGEDIDGMNDDTAVRLDNAAIDSMATELQTLGARVLRLHVAKANAAKTETEVLVRQENADFVKTTEDEKVIEPAA